MGVEEVPFSELLSNVVDNRGKTCPTSDVGIPLIATNCIRNDLLYPAYEKVRYVSQETYDTWFRGHPKPGDLIFVTKGSPGRVCMAPDPVDFCIAQDMVGVRADPKKVYSEYLFALLRSPVVQARIEQMHVGTLIPHFKKGDFDKLLLPVPDHKTQRFIGDTYFELSAKIELNRRMNQTLEAMTQAIFKSWFVDFDPVRAKAIGEQPPGLAPYIADLFPDAFEESELGEIPKGWQVGTLGTITDEVRDTVKADDIEDGTPYIALKHMPRRSIALDSWDMAEGIASAKRSFNTGDILFGKLRPYFHKVGPAPLDGICSTDIVVCRPKDDSWYGLALGHLSSDDFVAYTDAGSTGTKMPRTNWRYMSRYSIALPPRQVAARFSAIVEPLISRIRHSIFEQQQRAELRDTLLPKLISGELRVPDVTERSTNERHCNTKA